MCFFKRKLKCNHTEYVRGSTVKQRYYLAVSHERYGQIWDFCTVCGEDLGGGFTNPHTERTAKWTQQRLKGTK